MWIIKSPAASLDALSAFHGNESKDSEAAEAAHYAKDERDEKGLIADVIAHVEIEVLNGLNLEGSGFSFLYVSHVDVEVSLSIMPEDVLSSRAHRHSTDLRGSSDCFIGNVVSLVAAIIIIVKFDSEVDDLASLISVSSVDFDSIGHILLEKQLKMAKVVGRNVLCLLAILGTHSVYGCLIQNILSTKLLLIFASCIVLVPF